MSQDELDALAAQHGGIAGQTQTGPTQEPDPDTNGVTKRAVPKERRTQRIVFKDGYSIELQPDTNDDGSTAGTYQVVKPLTEGPKNTGANGSSSSVRTVRGANGQDQIEVRDPSDPTGMTWVAVGGTVSNPDEDQIKAIQRQILEGQRGEREANQAAGKGYLTNDQVATIERDAQANKTSAADVEIRKQQLAQQAQDAERNAGLRQQEINNQSADVQLRAQAQQAQVAAQKAANDLAQKRLDLDKQYQDKQISLEEAKLEYQKSYDAAKQAADNAKLLLDQQTEADRRAEAAATNATQQRGQDMTSATAAADREQRAAESAQRAKEAATTAATQAANDLETNAQTGGRTGAEILNQRATAAQNTLNKALDLTNSKNFGLGTQVGPGFGAQLLSGINDWTAQLYGGQDTLKTAQDLVHAANPTLSGTPAGAGYTALLQQMLDAKKAQDAASQTSFTPPTGTTQPSATPPAPPSAPGAPPPTLDGQPTPDQYTPGGFAQSGIPEGSNRRVTVTPDGTVHLLFNPPTGTATPGQRGDLDQVNTGVTL